MSVLLVANHQLYVGYASSTNLVCQRHLDVNGEVLGVGETETSQVVVSQPVFLGLDPDKHPRNTT